VTRHPGPGIVVAGCAALMLQACATSTVSPTATKTASAQPSPTVPAPPTAIVTIPPSPTPTPTPQPVLAAVGPTCVARNLSLRLGLQDGGAGTGATVLVITDRGPGRCILRGTPKVEFLDASSRRVNVPVYDMPNGFFAPSPSAPPLNSPVGLLPLASSGTEGAAGIRGQAAIQLQYSDFACATSAPVTRVVITLPTGTLGTPIELPGYGTSECLPPSVGVTPFRAAEITL
jgi:Protein of unknown function (DUF4232)